MILCASSSCLSQNLYVSTNSGSGYALGQVNPATCQFCPELEIDFLAYPGQAMNDVVPLPNGQVVTIAGQNFITTYDPPSATPVISFVNNPPVNHFYTGGVLTPTGNVLITGHQNFPNGDFISTIWSYNPTANTMTIVGTLPTNNLQTLVQPFYWNGQLHAFGTDINGVPFNYLATITLGNPMVLNTLYTYPGTTFCGAPMASIPTGPNAGIYGGILDPICNGDVLFDFDITTNTTSVQCTIVEGYPYGLGLVPTGFPPIGACCITNAGTTTTPNTQICAGQTFNFTTAGEVLDANDVLNYVLFTNPSDTVGSIVATSTVPSFAFQAPLQAGVTYYFAAVAGNALGGNVNLNDPCLDFSNANTLVWKPLPTVVFSAPQPALCAGACSTVTATFTGTPPFSLTYTTPAPSTQTISSSGMSTTFQVCIPAGTALGAYQVQATQVSDVDCICN
jgi:hypothetical protein